MSAELHRETIAAAMQNAAVVWGEQVGRAIANAAKQHCPVDEGRLRSSITHLVTVQPSGGVTILVGSPLAYARWRHEGTGIYGPNATPIVPTTQKALKFRPNITGPMRPGESRKSREFIWRRSVKGTPGLPFLTKGLEDVFGPDIDRNPTQ